MTKQDIIKEMERKINHLTRRIKECESKAQSIMFEEGLKSYEFYMNWANDYKQERYGIARVYAFATQQDYEKVLRNLDKIGE